MLIDLGHNNLNILRHLIQFSLEILVTQRIGAQSCFSITLSKGND
jgi:hypothetical protein